MSDNDITGMLDRRIRASHQIVDTLLQSNRKSGDAELRTTYNQLAMMRAQLAILERLDRIEAKQDDRRKQIIAALDRKYPNLFSATDKAACAHGDLPIEEIVLRYMSKLS